MDDFKSFIKAFFTSALFAEVIHGSINFIFTISTALAVTYATYKYKIYLESRKK